MSRPIPRRSPSDQADSDRASRPSKPILGRYISVLDTLVNARAPLPASAIAKRLDLPLSSVYRLLAQLRAVRLVTYNEINNAYWLGLKCLEYGGLALEALDIREIALPFMRELCARSGESVLLTVRDGDEGVYVQTVEATRERVPWRWHTEVGSRVPLYAGASMKIQLAFLTREERDAILDRSALVSLASGTITDRAKLEAELANTRECGWASSLEELNDGAAGVSAPVFDHNGGVVAGLSISGPRTRLEPRIPELAGLVVDMALSVSSSLGYTKATGTRRRATDGRARAPVKNAIRAS